MIKGTGIYDFDRSKLLFSTVGTSINGHQLHEMLRDRFHIEMEMEAEKYALGIAAVGDTKEGFERLCDAIEQIDTETEFVASAEEAQETVSYARMKQLMSISQAMDAQQRDILWKRVLERSVQSLLICIRPEFRFLCLAKRLTCRPQKRSGIVSGWDWR